MAKINVIANVKYDALATELGIEIHEGRKNVRLFNEGKAIYISGVITDKEKKLANIDWVTTSKDSGQSYKEVVESIKNLSGNATYNLVAKAQSKQEKTQNQEQLSEVV